MKVYIRVNCPKCRGAAMPAFKRKEINESKFSDGERFYEYHCEFNPDGVSEVEWLSQEDEYHTSGWSEEVKRAFKANGAKPGHVISVKFGSRDTDFIEEFELVIE